MSTRAARIFFIEMMGVPGSFDASVYDHFEDKDQEPCYVPPTNVRILFELPE